jgi:hypothetical protein
VADNYDAINTRIGELLGDENTGGETPPVIVPNTDPSVENDLAQLEQGEVAVIDVLFNDTDADGDTLTLQSVNGAIGGTTEIVDGRVVYTPDEDFSGVDSFTYVVPMVKVERSKELLTFKLLKPSQSLSRRPSPSRRQSRQWSKDPKQQGLPFRTSSSLTMLHRSRM